MCSDRGLLVLKVSFLGFILFLIARDSGLEANVDAFVWLPKSFYIQIPYRVFYGLKRSCIDAVSGYIKSFACAQVTFETTDYRAQNDASNGFCYFCRLCGLVLWVVCIQAAPKYLSNFPLRNWVCRNTGR